jgi:enoyl-CoA hydratase
MSRSPLTPATSEITVSLEGSVGRITLTAPDRLNAVDARMLEALADAVTALDAREDVRVISLTGAGRGFCSGAHLSAISGLDQVGTETLDGANRAVRAVVGSGTPVLALVNGVAAGVGCSLALACDYALATESATFMLAFAKIGLMPDGGATALVAAAVGRARALRMALTAEQVPAATAHDWGLIAEVCPDADFADRSRALEAALAATAPAAVAATTAAVNAATLPDLEAILDREAAGQAALLVTEDFAEGVAAFGERRPARFTGR